jgi:ketosteroid isomerase-like protein
MESSGPSRDTASRMSEENVALLRELESEWHREWDSGEVSVRPEHWHPDVEFLPRRTATEGAYRGISGIEAFVADTIETFEKFEFQVELEDLGDQVLAWGTIHVRARGSGLETDIPIGGLYGFRDGKIVRWEDFGSKDVALEAAALSE